MDESVVQTLRTLPRDDLRRLEATLRDLHPLALREVAVIVEVAHRGPDIRKLVDESGISEDWAAWGVRAWTRTEARTGPPSRVPERPGTLADVLGRGNR